MHDPAVLRATRVAPAAGEPLLGGRRYDYADAFEIRTHQPEPRSALEFARAALVDDSPPWMRSTIRVVHRHVIRFRLGPGNSSGHLLGWSILTAEPDVVQLQAVSPLVQAMVIGRMVRPTHVRFSTYLFYARPAVARAVWTVIGPLHRVIAPRLLEGAANGPRHLSG